MTQCISLTAVIESILIGAAKCAHDPEYEHRKLSWRDLAKAVASDREIAAAWELYLKAEAQRRTVEADRAFRTCSIEDTTE